jgi:hypothetical protein
VKKCGIYHRLQEDEICTRCPRMLEPRASKNH